MNSEIRTDDLLMVAKRENNQKRSFLYVNPLQGKHVPVSPSKALHVIEQLAGRVGVLYPEEALMVIGFSETATAIGTALAMSCQQVKAFLTTTRECIDGADYIDFSESHSHATEQRLYVDALEQWLRCTDRVVFAEDEVTTGNTIENLMHALQKRFPDIPMRFGIASLLNSMTDERLEAFAQRDIHCTWLARIPFGYRIQEMERFHYEPLRKEPFFPEALRPAVIRYRRPWNQRIAAGTEDIREGCRQFVHDIVQQLPEMQKPQRLLVLGTEEIMYPGMLLGEMLEGMGHTVRFHATTRSPIETSREKDYPLHRRFPLVSLYDPERVTYIYDLERYDRVILVTDGGCAEGLATLTGALEMCGNTSMTVIQWEDTAL